MTPPTTTERGEETRRRIVDAASQLFVEHGFAATSLNDIITAGGVTKGGFYFHFASKVALGIEVMATIQAAQRADILAALTGRERAVDRLAELARAAARSQKTPSGAALCRLCFELSGQPDAPQIEPFEEWFAITADLFREAQAEGDADPDIDPDAAGRFAVTAFIGLEHVADVRGLRAALPDATEEYLAFTFRACGLHPPVPESDAAASPTPPSTTKEIIE